MCIIHNNNKLMIFCFAFSLFYCCISTCNLFEKKKSPWFVMVLLLLFLCDDPQCKMRLCAAPHETNQIKVPINVKDLCAVGFLIDFIKIYNNINQWIKTTHDFVIYIFLQPSCQSVSCISLFVLLHSPKTMQMQKQQKDFNQFLRIVLGMRHMPPSLPPPWSHHILR